MTYIRYIPSPPLNAYIEDLYYLDGPAPYPRQKVLPVASSNLMINLSSAFDVYKPDEAKAFITCTDSWWVGIWSTYHSVDWPPNVQLFGAHFKPSGREVTPWHRAALCPAGLLICPPTRGRRL